MKNTAKIIEGLEKTYQKLKNCILKKRIINNENIYFRRINR